MQCLFTKDTATCLQIHPHIDVLDRVNGLQTPQPVLLTHESFLLLHLLSGVADESGPHLGHEVPVKDGLLLEGSQDQHASPLRGGG